MGSSEETLEQQQQRLATAAAAATRQQCVNIEAAADSSSSSSNSNIVGGRWRCCYGLTGSMMMIVGGLRVVPALLCHKRLLAQWGGANGLCVDVRMPCSGVMWLGMLSRVCLTQAESGVW
jgi:hypothetical protein